MGRKREILVGGVVLLAMVVTVLGTLWLKGEPLGRGTRTVTAVFSEVGQLMNGNSVKVRGVSIGRVSGIQVLTSGDGVRVEMRITSEVTLPDSAGVLVSPESMFGDWQAEIVDRGDFPRYPFSDPAAEGDLPGHALPDISRLTATADEIAQNLTTLTDRVELAFTEETAMNLSRAIGNIERVSQGLSDVLEQQATRFEDMADGVSASATELGAAAQAARTSFEAVSVILEDPGTDSMLADAQVTVGNLREVSSEMSDAMANFRQTAVRADSTFARLDRLTQAVESGEGSVGALFADDALAARTEETLVELRLLLADIQANPKKYVRLSIF